MDKTWMRCTDRLSHAYLRGVENFLRFAFKHTTVKGEIPCPCVQCNNVFHKTKDEVREDLIVNGIVKGYTRWLYHGDTSRNLEEVERKQAHLYVLRNCEEVQPFLHEFEQSNNSMEFDDWFYHRVLQMHKEKNSQASGRLYSLARGPLVGVQRFTGYEINGFRFHTKELEENRVKQNSGVLVRGRTDGQDTNYYGVLTEIVELQYLESKRIVLFKCDWWDVDHIGKGVKIDKHGFVSVNTNRKLATNEPFVLATQAEQVFYLKDNLHPNWSIILNGHSAYFSGGAASEETFQKNAQDTSICTFEADEDVMNWRRNDLEVISTSVTMADDIVEDVESEPETDDEDLLL